MIKSDLWSLGITILELCLLKQGLIGITWTSDKKQKALMRQIKKLKDDKTYSYDLTSLLTNLLQSDPKKRGNLEIVATKLEQLLNIPLRATTESNKGVEEQFGEHKILSSEAKGRRKPGEVSQEEIDDNEGIIRIVQDPIPATDENIYKMLKAFAERHE